MITVWTCISVVLLVPYAHLRADASPSVRSRAAWVLQRYSRFGWLIGGIAFLLTMPLVGAMLLEPRWARFPVWVLVPIIGQVAFLATSLVGYPTALLAGLMHYRYAASDTSFPAWSAALIGLTAGIMTIDLVKLATFALGLRNPIDLLTEVNWYVAAIASVLWLRQRDVRRFGR